MGTINKINVNGDVHDIGTNVYKDMNVSKQRFTELLDRDFYIPTLPSPPSIGTLTYVDTDASVCNFRIGQQCRVKAVEAEYGYAFYQLYDIVNGKAYWKESGGGSSLPGNIYLTGADYYNKSVRTIKQGVLSNE